MPLETMPNLRPDVALIETHTFALPPMCPVSGNPHPGSTLSIRYRPAGAFLEVDALQAYIESFIGGTTIDGARIRDMEQTIQVIAVHCRAVLGVAVTVTAQLVIATPSGTHTMTLEVEAGR